MTCKCGAQFCYTCGAKWRTCACTETDEANRQAALRRRRGERETVREREAAEIARIVAQIEELERQTAREHREEELRRAKERQREEAELARLEEQRLREEEERRVEEARLERLLRQTLRDSVLESCRALQQAWASVRSTELHSLDSRHVASEQQHATAQADALVEQTRQSEEAFRAMDDNIARRKSTMEERHRAELAAFTSDQHSLEDEVFLQVQLHLRGKPDKGTREQRLQELLQQHRLAAHREFLTRQRRESRRLEADAKMERQGLSLANESAMASIEQIFRMNYEKLATAVAADRKWFNLLLERRQNMIDADRRLMLEALDAGQDPSGLTRETAATIGPFLNDTADLSTVTASQSFAAEGCSEEQSGDMLSVGLAASSRSTTPTPSLVELATVSEQLLEKLEHTASPATSKRGLSKSANDQLVLNSAFAWMTGAIEIKPTKPKDRPIVPPSGLVRSHAVSRRARPHTRRVSAVSTASSADDMIPSPLQPRIAISPASDAPSEPNTPGWPLQAQPLYVSNGLGAASPALLTTCGTHGSTRPGLKIPLPDVPQDRVLGGFVPVTASAETGLRNLINSPRHRRQASSTDTSGSLASASSQATSMSTFFSPIGTSDPPLAKRVKDETCGDGLLLHRLIISPTNAGTMPRSASLAASMSSVSPISPLGGVVEGSGKESQTRVRPSRSIRSM
jgi:hypothetical protein